jgi:hypothetical protein
MRDALIFLLIVAVAILGYLLHSQTSVLTDQQRQLRELSEKMVTNSKSASLQLQGECAKQARLEYNEGGWKKEQMAGFTNHYNEKMNKCFMLIESTTPSTAKDGTFFTNKTLSDAFEGQNYGLYVWQSDKKKKYWEVPPFECDVTLPSGEKKMCQSSDEFGELIKVYMQ